MHNCKFFYCTVYKPCSSPVFIKATSVRIRVHKKVRKEDDEMLLRWNTELPNNIKKFERIVQKYEEMLMVTTSNADVADGIADVGRRYVKLTTYKHSFVSTLKKEISTRELNKHELFKEARLNIKHSKFSGYDSCTDVYTFQSEFEKLYLRTTPKRVLSDLLINKFLSEPALSLVKGVEDIQEIWERLKSAYETRICCSLRSSIK